MGRKLLQALLDIFPAKGAAAIRLRGHCSDMLDQFLDINIAIDKVGFQGQQIGILCHLQIVIRLHHQHLL